MLAILFLERKIGFLDIGRLVKKCYETTEYKEITSLEDVLEADRAARGYVINNYSSI